MKAKDLRERSLEDLKELATSLRKDFFQNRLKNFTNRLDDTSAIRKSRQELARVITLIGEKSRPAAGVAGEKAAKPAKAKKPAAPKAEAKPKAPKAPKAKAEGAEKPAKAPKAAKAAK